MVLLAARGITGLKTPYQIHMFSLSQPARLPKMLKHMARLVGGSVFPIFRKERPSRKITVKRSLQVQGQPRGLAHRIISVRSICQPRRIIVSANLARNVIQRLVRHTVRRQIDL